MFRDSLTLVRLCSSATKRPSRFTRWGTFHRCVFQLHVSRSGLCGVRTPRHGGMLCVVWCRSVWTLRATVELSTGTNQHVSVSAGVELRHQGHLRRAADEAALCSLTAPRRRDLQFQRENTNICQRTSRLARVLIYDEIRISLIVDLLFSRLFRSSWRTAAEIRV